MARGGEFGAVDLYAVGWPCQSYSVAGKRGGLSDNRGALMAAVPFQIQKNKPKSYVLENVQNLIHGFPKEFTVLMNMLRNMLDVSSGEPCPSV